jgi:hypothetical protein
VGDSPRQRFNQLLEKIGLCHAHLGVIRRTALDRTLLIGNELGSDIHFLAELALYGRFCVVPEYLFFRRFHEKSSSWSRDDIEHQRSYYDPGGKRGFTMHTWKKFHRLYAAVWRAPLPLAQKLQLSRDVGRSAVWNARDLVSDVTNIFSAPR